jgi:hypothetical protein
MQRCRRLLVDTARVWALGSGEGDRAGCARRTIQIVANQQPAALPKQQHGI